MNTKKCTKCNIKKKITEFYKCKTGKFGVSSICKKCLKEKQTIYYKTHKKESKKYYKNNQRKILNQKKFFRKKFPWIYILNTIKQRCNNYKSKDYKYYGGRGIKNFLTINDIKFLWFRDKAYLMKKPSIHRKNNNGNYCIENCKYLEWNKHNSKIYKSKKGGNNVFALCNSVFKY